MSLKSEIKKALRFSISDLILFLRAFLWLGVMRAAIQFVAFQKIARWLGAKEGNAAPAPSSPQTQIGQRVGWAVETAARRTPWQSACLAQALTGAVLLRGKKIPVLVYLGVAKGLNGEDFSAHAWLRCGEDILTGKAGHERFHVIATFVTQ